MAASASGLDRDVHALAWRGSATALADLLRADPSLARAEDRSESGERNTPLHYAACQGHAEVCALLLDAGALLEARNEGGVTALFLAAQANQPRVVELLLARGASPDVRDKIHGFSAVDVAATSAIVALLRGAT